ncbi:MAG: serine/threonine protein kinase [Phycisphaeraceae bacterium]|nr:serine/threonine protein kinase [Phycisphaeraceae bacterium]MCB9847386.1 serine/threonine protein kinase [Phycisphaeraceae bacterium]
MAGDLRQRAREIFLKTRALSGAEQSTRLDDLCGSDDDLRSEVQTLLREEMEQTEAGEAPSVFVASDDHFETEESLIDQRIGQYRIKAVIAGGGMGTVYEAYQEHPKRVVALKIMKAGITSRVMLRRFEYESQVLARLRHPGIAQVYEAGAHDDGKARVPFFAMEYVPGAKSIIDYAQSRGLDTRERLELFMQVCDAVAHGHQKGVIHRDLKPSNILVDSGGQPKIIDFGVARSTDSDLAVTCQTDIGQLIGTVQYMSPEQCNADPHDLDTRSDVYALGVVLYELLTGELPYDIRQCAIHEAVRVIQQDVPPRPSTIFRTLRGDVETIVLTAIEKDRERRYQSAAALSKDIGRYLGNQPIEATPPSTIYRFTKFVRRNRTMVAAVTLVALALAGGSVGTSVGMYRAVQERDRAELKAQEALEVNNFLNNDLLAQADPENRGRRVTVREVIDIASERIGGRFTDQPLVEASVRMTLGRAYQGLGEMDLALPHLREAIRIRERELGPRNRETLEARSQYASLLETTDKWEEAEQELRDALRLSGDALGETDPLTLQMTRQLAATLGDQGRNAEAAQILEDLLETYKSRQEQADRDENLAQIETMLTLAETWRILGELSRAEALYHEVIDAYEVAYRVEHPRMLNAMNNLGLVLWEEGRLGEAEQMFRDTLDGRVRVLGELHLATARTCDNLGLILSEQGKFAEAERLQRRALSILEQILGPDNPDTIICENNLADTVVGLGRLDEAETIMADVVRRARAALPSGHWHLGVYLKSHAETLIDLGRFEEAQQSLDEAYSIQLAAFGPDHKRTQDVIRVMVDCLSKWGRADDAKNWHARLTP